MGCADILVALFEDLPMSILNIVILFAYLDGNDSANCPINQSSASVMDPDIASVTAAGHSARECTKPIPYEVPENMCI